MKLWKIFPVFTQEKGFFFFFFGVFPVAGMRGKKKLQGRLAGLLPFFFSKCESQYSYCDTGLDRQGLGDGPGRAAGA